MSTISREVAGKVCVITINRPQVRNAIDRPTAQALLAALEAFEADDSLRVAVLTGSAGSFCAGADLAAVAQDGERRNALQWPGEAPLGPSRLLLSKPLIASIEGHAVAGGLELALLADMRVAADDAVLGVFCRRFGVPLIDGGSVRLPRLIGQSRALDLILTGRPVLAGEALHMGLVNRVVPQGEALTAALALAQQLADFPQACLLADRASVYQQWELPLQAALEAEFKGGLAVINSGESRAGAQRFTQGSGRHGRFGDKA
ncbi:crotonase/enoyl-CoA hydratase family protein [Atopomonas sediminilitoris]|uniref:crotonase/enoyl-CoA hydratase family protein n=1 Tax=Atopomonas sediminilitoris TaxID=2919919 RepID=UPI001F4EF684|nr:crotonase/enoyl-CoA hydratase family protein [Atopomonas sediminilitoris]MCJ8169897.1 crotonase/enoyl-CoA hydratase family protein [Atopomonas sediminilitoris]